MIDVAEEDLHEWDCAAQTFMFKSRDDICLEGCGRGSGVLRPAILIKGVKANFPQTWQECLILPLPLNQQRRFDTRVGV